MPETVVCNVLVAQVCRNVSHVLVLWQNG